MDHHIYIFYTLCHTSHLLLPTHTTFTPSPTHTMNTPSSAHPLSTFTDPQSYPSHHPHYTLLLTTFTFTHPQIQTQTLQYHTNPPTPTHLRSAFGSSVTFFRGIGLSCLSATGLLGARTNEYPAPHPVGSPTPAMASWHLPGVCVECVGVSVQTTIRVTNFRLCSLHLPVVYVQACVSVRVSESYLIMTFCPSPRSNKLDAIPTRYSRASSLTLLTPISRYPVPLLRTHQPSRPQSYGSCSTAPASRRCRALCPPP